MWKLDLTKPPVALTKPEASVLQVGDAVAITWVGKSGVSELDAGEDMTVSALYDIATGKQRGKTMSAKERPLSNEKNPFLIKLADGFYFADATKADPDSIYLSDYNGSPWLPQPASDTTSSAYDITSKLSVVDDPPAWSMSSDKPANSAQLWDRTTKTKLAETACKGTDLPNPVVSPSGRYAVFGSAAFDLNERKVWCVKAPADGAAIKRVSGTGTIYGESNERAYTQAWGQDKPTVLPDGATMPSYVLDSATVYTVTEPTAKYRVTGEWDGNNLVCSIRSQSEHTDVKFSIEDASGGMGLTSHQGSLYASAEAEAFPSDARGVLDDATKALAS